MQREQCSQWLNTRTFIIPDTWTQSTGLTYLGGGNGGTFGYALLIVTSLRYLSGCSDGNSLSFPFSLVFVRYNCQPRGVSLPDVDFRVSILTVKLLITSYQYWNTRVYYFFFIVIVIIVINFFFFTVLSLLCIWNYIVLYLFVEMSLWKYLTKLYKLLEF